LQTASLCHHSFALSSCFCVAQKGRYEFETDSCDCLCEFCGIANIDNELLSQVISVISCEQFKKIVA
ncbi:MAG: hypothetical protein D3923_20135, partial [Candidatus Electrothrix sp. AR3]|nr:hypothetical protein [Candidatus Electrothrix sp. AR3]